MATLNYDYIDASILQGLKPVVENQSMRSRPLLRKLKENVLVDGSNPLVFPISFGAATTQTQWMSRGTTVNLVPMANMGPLSFTPALLTANFIIYKEDELLLTQNPGKIVDFAKTWTEMLVESIDWRLTMRLHDQGTTGTAPAEISSLKDAVGATTNTFGGRSRSSYAYWKPFVITGTTDFPGCDDPLQLEDSTKEAYILKILQAGYAKSKRLKGVGPTDIFVGQYHFDLIERILDPQRTGDLKKNLYGQWGFDALNYRGRSVIVADEDLVDAQIDSNSERYSDGNDYDDNFTTVTASSASDITALNAAGRFLFLNLEKGKNWMRFWVHPAANWTWGDWEPLANQPGAKVKHMFIQCQLVSNCSAVHGTINNIYSPVKYSR
ncbi:MAG: phage major capsid protein [bacterium]